MSLTLSGGRVIFSKGKFILEGNNKQAIQCSLFLSMILKLPVPLFLTTELLKKPIVDVKGGERVLATFVGIGILVTAVVPPVLLTWPTSSPTKLLHHHGH